MAEPDTDESSWEHWQLRTWRIEERKNQNRRDVLIDINNGTQSLPPKGDETRGWRWHWRRGLVGAVRDWAEGSPFRVSFMLAELVTQFNVRDAVAERLGLRLSREQVEEAKVDSYIVSRVREALHQLKQCRSAVEQTDYGVGLAMVAPTREAAATKVA